TKLVDSLAHSYLPIAVPSGRPFLPFILIWHHLHAFQPEFAPPQINESKYVSLVAHTLQVFEVSSPLIPTRCSAFSRFRRIVVSAPSQLTTQHHMWRRHLWIPQENAGDRAISKIVLFSDIFVASLARSYLRELIFLTTAYHIPTPRRAWRLPG